MSRAHIASIAAEGIVVDGEPINTNINSVPLQVYGAELENDNVDVYTGGSVNALKEYVSDLQYGGMDGSTNVMFMGWLDDLSDSTRIIGGDDSPSDSGSSSSDDDGDEDEDLTPIISVNGGDSPSSNDIGIFIAGNDDTSTETGKSTILTDGIIDNNHINDEKLLTSQVVRNSKASPLVDF